MSKSPRAYVETFDNGPGGWLAWVAGGGGPRRLEIRDSAAIVRSPWTVDFNHAPPGAGYLHLLYVLITTPKDQYPRGHYDPLADRNRFVEDEYSRDFTNARFTVKVRGELDLKGSQFLLLVQSSVPPVVTNWVLHGQPIRVTKDWSEQTLILKPDPSQWTCLGTRGPGADCATYGEAPIADALRDVNVDIILVLFPLDIAPARPIAGNLHKLRAGRDYELDRSRLPSGHVELDELRIEYAG
jgi:hypothetical protein